MLNKRILVMAGGTGGHVFPALACAKALIEQGHNVHWLGTQKGLEARVILAHQIPLHYLSITGLRGKSRLTLLLAPLNLVRALWQAIAILRRFKPDVVLGMGGFVTGPAGLAAWLLGIPLVIHEQNAIAGLTNRLLARLAQQVLTAFPLALTRNSVCVGNPLRAEILRLNQDKTSHAPFKVLVFGGSLGAQVFNQVLPQVYAKLSPPIQLWHQTGLAQYQATRAAYAMFPEVKVSAFIDNMALAYQWADLVICRAGALTVSELAQAGVAAILVPYPHAVDDHQTANAHVLVNARAAWLLPQTAFNQDNLLNLLQQLDGAELQQRGKAAKQCAQPEATAQVVAHCLALCR